MYNSNLNLFKRKKESCVIYQRLCNSESMYTKYYELECDQISECITNALNTLCDNSFILNTGSAGEGTDITALDYDKHMNFTAPCYISDRDYMHVWSDVRGTGEGDTLPERFDNYIYCQAERGEHTTDGFRKLRIIHSPELNVLGISGYQLWMDMIHMSTEHGFMSSSKVMATKQSESMYISQKQFVLKTGLGTQGPSHILQVDSSATDLVPCFYVKTWPNEAESWFKRQTHWPDRKLKSKIRKTGYLLVPTGNSNSQESDLEWRCSFSIAEKILFQSMTKFQRCTFVILKVLLKEYLPSDINTDGEKQLLSTYHMKTLFLWSLECSKVTWEPENMLDIIGYMLDELSGWINQQFFPHYFIPSVNLFDRRRLYGREKYLICFISAIRNDLSNKIKQSQFFMGQLEVNVQEINLILASNSMLDHRLLYLIIDRCIIKIISGDLQNSMHIDIFDKMKFLAQFNFSHSMLIEGLLSIKPEVHPQKQHLYRAIYTDPIHDKLLMEVMPGLMNQYHGCIHLAKYCMAARDGQVLPDMLHKAESLLMDTLHVDPCSGYVKLACLYTATGDFVQGKDILHRAENNFLLKHKNMVTSALRHYHVNGVESTRLSTEVYTFNIHEVFQKWTEGQIITDIVVTWPEYITVPDLFQFELIHETRDKVVTSCIFGLHLAFDKMLGINCQLQWPPLSLIKLLKFVCAFNSGPSSTSHMINLVAELSLSFTACADVNDIYTVFNMAAWCYVKIKKYKPAGRILTVAIGTSSETEGMNRCAFSHHFVAYVIGQCLL